MSDNFPVGTYASKTSNTFYDCKGVSICDLSSVHFVCLCCWPALYVFIKFSICGFNSTLGTYMASNNENAKKKV